jgi:hypothetical protein
LNKNFVIVFPVDVLAITGLLYVHKENNGFYRPHYDKTVGVGKCGRIAEKHRVLYFCG